MSQIVAQQLQGGEEGVLPSLEKRPVYGGGPGSNCYLVAGGNWDLRVQRKGGAWYWAAGKGILQVHWGAGGAACRDKKKDEGVVGREQQEWGAVVMGATWVRK